ncbi:FAD binding domain-containing protein [Nonomuraea cavernae]|uniref:Carbon monoxide dehydrogenase n=1 Tax=Nonomuraea cavernae TaxID=2045107 RepID=A0A917Z3Y8_9ACTN|nr:FAD binding domain-containing protein [Nonomuraea cavernae]MCA2187929.1 FAD binding domain-containing protein [Nonomuraea cavernae]GGO72277.1 carbon monoxide dehydrogenase [Nonomuraea cavernae]
MITKNFAYHAPADLHGVVTALSAASGTAVVLGGGTMLVPDMTHGKTVADVVVDLSRAGLSGITLDGGGGPHDGPVADDGVSDGRVADGRVADGRVADGRVADGGVVVVGATTTYAHVLSDPRSRTLAPLLRRVAGGVTGGPQIRNKGTIGGSACYANPSSEVPAALVALGARLRLASAGGTREVAAGDFFTGAFATARRPGEVLAAIALPAPTGPCPGYTKLKLNESSWPIATAACVPGPDGALRVALGAVAATPLLVTLDPPEAGVADPAWRAHVREVVDAALAEPWSDVLADGDYRRRVAPVVAVRAVADALQQAEGES